MSDMFFAVITGIIAVILFIYVFFAARCKGPILSNTYLFASEKERSKINKKATSWNICLYTVFVLIICVIVYAVKESIKSEKDISRH